MGLQETRIERLLQAMETAKLPERQEVEKAVSTTFSRIAEMLEAPVHTAVIPAAGGQHRLIAIHVMQRLLLRVIGEAVESSISNIVLVLAPGMKDALYTPLKEALDLAVVPSIKLHYSEQAKAEGLGDAILQAEAFVGKEPFAVSLPDDIVRERIGRAAHSRELRSMMDAFRDLDGANFLAVTSVLKSKMPHCGVAKIGAKEVLPKIFPIIQLTEKPDSTHLICRSTRAFGIVGRYLLQPDVFGPLHELREKGRRPVELTDALERLHQEGHNVYAFELRAPRQDIGEILGQASELIGDFSSCGSRPRLAKGVTP